MAEFCAECGFVEELRPCGDRCARCCGEIVVGEALDALVAERDELRAKLDKAEHLCGEVMRMMRDRGLRIQLPILFKALEDIRGSEPDATGCYHDRVHKEPGNARPAATIRNSRKVAPGSDATAEEPVDWLAESLEDTQKILDSLTPAQTDALNRDAEFRLGDAVITILKCEKCDGEFPWHLLIAGSVCHACLRYEGPIVAPCHCGRRKFTGRPPFFCDSLPCRRAADLAGVGYE